jgi:beta-lactamase class D
MKYAFVMISTALWASASLAQSCVFPIPEESVQAVFADRKGTFVLMDCSSDAMSIFRPEASAEKLPPCSTFKIWNTLIGLESGIISSSEDAFYKWDGKTRAIPEWNKDLNLKEAFRVSCAPAFQDLARRIGPQRMQSWLDKIAYGDRDISSGVGVFWLPAPGRKTLLISAEEQARLIYRLVSGKLPFSEKVQAVLKDFMTIKKTEHGVLYGKTGSGVDDTGKFNLGWFVGYVESNGKAYAFACAARGERLMGKDARAITETILEKNGYL